MTGTPEALAAFIEASVWHGSLERGEAILAAHPVDVPDGKGRTALALAVRACVDSYWADRRSPESVEALLRAGASAAAIKVPSGYAEIDRLLAKGASSG